MTLSPRWQLSGRSCQGAVAASGLLRSASGHTDMEGRNPGTEDRNPGIEDNGPGMAFDHAGIATRNADELERLFGDLLGAPVAHSERFDGMDVVFLDLENGYLELLEPTEGGPIDRYLERNGPGIHHLAFATDDIAAALETARGMDIALVDEESRPGAWGHEVAFLHPDSTGGVLVEFVEHK